MAAHIDLQSGVTIETCLTSVYHSLVVKFQAQDVIDHDNGISMFYHGLKVRSHCAR